MPVYVDDSFIEATVPNGGRSVTSKWCHLMADTREELDAMADKIGLQRRWIQSVNKYGGILMHYDVTVPRRAAAVLAGAVEITWREGAALTNRKVALRDGEPVVGVTFLAQLEASRQADA